jgi:hypothetical protein
MRSHPKLRAGEASKIPLDQNPTKPPNALPNSSQQLMMAGPSFGLGETAVSQDAGEKPLLIPHERLALPISAWGIAEHAVHQLPGCRDVSKATKGWT